MAENRSRFEPDAQAFAALVAATGSAERYEELRQRLIRYFRWERCPVPEDCADEAFNRLAKRLVEGERVESLEAYLYGVARFLVKEERARKASQDKALLLLPRKAGAAELSPDLDCLDACIASLPADQRDFILRYYEGEAGGRIRNRQAMAQQFGLQMNALRNRALRLRDRLEACVRGCLSKGKT
jgi:DNA-directed RNA polymerase specialized sigma24 family protein